MVHECSHQNELTQMITEALIDAAKNVIPKAKNKGSEHKSNEWISSETIGTIERKRQDWKTYGNESAEYKAAKMECKKQIKRDKNAHFEAQCMTLNRSNISCLYFRVMKEIFKKKKNVKSVGMIDMKGTLVTDKHHILSVWEEFKKEL